MSRHMSRRVSRRRLSRLLTAVALAFACALVSACGKDDEVNAVVKDLDAFTEELVSKVKSAPDPSAGVEEAQKYLDSRRAEIVSKMNSIKSVREAQLKEETRKRLMERVTENVMSVSGLQIEYVDESLRDPAFKAKLEKLTQDYQSLFNR